jgi:hypothetical protein
MREWVVGPSGYVLSAHRPAGVGFVDRCGIARISITIIPVVAIQLFPLTALAIVSRYISRK